VQKNPVCYWELASNDAEKSINFLKEVFDWDVELDEKIGIYEVPAGEAPNGFSGGGVFTLKKAKLPFLTIYIKVNDIDVKVKKIEELGGHIVIPTTEIPGGSKICLFNEPSGVTFAMLQSKRS